MVRKKLSKTVVSAIQASSVSLLNLAKAARGKNCKFATFKMAVPSKTGISKKIPKYFKYV